MAIALLDRQSIRRKKGVHERHALIRFRFIEGDLLTMDLSGPLKGRCTVSFRRQS